MQYRTMNRVQFKTSPVSFPFFRAAFRTCIFPSFLWDFRELTPEEKTDKNAYQFTIFVDTARENDAHKFYMDVLEKNGLDFEFSFYEKHYATTQKRKDEASPWLHHGK